MKSLFNTDIDVVKRLSVCTASRAPPSTIVAWDDGETKLKTGFRRFTINILHNVIQPSPTKITQTQCHHLHPLLWHMGPFQLKCRRVSSNLFLSSRCISRFCQFSNEEAFDTDIWVLDLFFGMAVHSVHHGNGLLEDQPDRRRRWFLHNQGGLVLVQPVEGLFDRLHCRHQL